MKSGFLKVFIFLILFLKSVFGCALCTLQTPTVHVKVTFNKTDLNDICGMDFEWVFSKNFTDFTVLNYDLNDNKILDKNELKEVKKALLDYLEPRAFLTMIKHYEGDKAFRDRFKTDNVKVFIENGLLKLQFTALFNLSVKEGTVLSLKIKDYEEYFNFGVVSLDNDVFSDSLYIRENTNLDISFYEFSKNKLAYKTYLKESTKDEKLGFFDELNIKIYTILKSSFSGNSGGFATLFLIFISFIYGAFHALGPGHGKMLVSSYFLSQNKSYFKSFIFATKVGFIHIFMSFLITSISLFILESTTRFTNQASFYTIKINAILIFLVAIFVLYQKITKKHTCSCCNQPKNQNNFNIFYQPQKINKIIKTPKKKTNTMDFLIAFGAGGVPCPGTVLVFVLAYHLGKFYLAFLSAFFISFGMSLVVFFAALFASSIKQSTSTQKIKTFLEYFGVLVMIGLSLWMMFFVDIRIV